MREPFTQLYVHLVWATWDRQPVLRPAWKRRVLACIQAECEMLKAEVVALNAMPDHVHLLARMPTALSVAALVKQVKGASSHLVTHDLAPDEWFKWQGGYGAFSVSTSAVPEVKNYILHQEQHHADATLVPDWEGGVE